MSEIINDRKVFSLLEVSKSIQKTLLERYTTSFWIKAEMNKLNYYSQSGHCYPDLVEKGNGKVISQMKSILWKNDFERINNKFKQVLKEPIKDGINILFCASIVFDPTHGLSLKIIDIDPHFSLGELEKEKQETIDRLTSEGIFNKNQRLSISLLPQRIAIISVETSKGYQDFIKVIDQNAWSYKFFKILFPALLQGDKSIQSILYQLGRIKRVAQHFDAVAIIRGGGGDIGLSSYNNYELCKEIAQFPIPIITGIGHATNITVAEMVSFKNAITPTELADYLIQKFHNFSVPVKKAEEIVVDRSKRILKDEKINFFNLAKNLQSVTRHELLKNNNEIESHQKSIFREAKFLLENGTTAIISLNLALKKEATNSCDNSKVAYFELKKLFHDNLKNLISHKNQSLETISKTVSILDPVNILRRGFTITRLNGKTISSIQNVGIGNLISTIMSDGELQSRIDEIK